MKLHARTADSANTLQSNGGSIMVLESMFIASQDTADHRVCGTCGDLKPIEEFYKDGTDKEGSPKTGTVDTKKTRFLETKMKK